MKKVRFLGIADEEGGINLFYRYGLLLYLFLLVAPPKYSSLLLILLVGVFIIDFYKNRFQIKINLQLYPLIIYFLVYAIGLIYTSDMRAGTNSLLRIMSFILLPLIFSRVYQKNMKIAEQAVSIFIISLLLILTFFFFAENKQDYFFHPTYIGMYANLAIIFCFHRFFNRDENNKSLYLFLTFLFFVSQVITESRTQIGIAALLMILGLILVLKRNLKNYRLTLTVLALSVTTFFILFNYSDNLLIYKFSKLIDQKTDFIRQRNWETNSLVLKDNWIFGVGTGDSVNELNKFRSKEWHESLESYNSHNQYIESLLDVGVLGISSLLFLLLNLLRNGIKSRNFVLIGFFIVLSVSFLTESILERQKGICFVSFFYCLLILDGGFKKR